MYVVLNLCMMFTECLLNQTSSGVILPADLQTLESYSRRIKHIHLSTFKEKVSNHIYSSITQHLFNNNSCLFSALRCFTIHKFNGISEGNLVILPLIASSSLSVIKIHGVTDAIEIHLASFLHGIANSHPSPSSTIHALSSLFLDGIIKMSTLAQLENFKKLSTLEIKFHEDFSNAIFSSLSRLPSLSALSLSAYFAYDLESPAKPVVYSFSNLRRLILGGNGNAVLRILRSIYGERLLRVFLGFGRHSTTDTLQACVKRCPEMAPHMLFYFIFLHPSEDPHRNVFPPLPNNYAQLRSFNIKSAVTIPLEHFRNLFDHVRMGLWSALETLGLHFGGDPKEPLKNWHGIQQVVPLSSLSVFVASCPRLRTLDLYLYYPFDEGDRETRILEDYIQNSQSNHKLANLKIVFLDPFVTVPRPGGVMDAVTVSLFIDHLFPNLQSFDISDMVGDVRRDWYSGIKAMVKNYRNMRERKVVKGAPIVSK